MSDDEQPDLSDPAAIALAVIQLRAAGETDAADELVRHAAGTVAKSMNTLSGSEGGFLAPPACRSLRQRRRKRLRRVLKAIADEVEGNP